MSDIEFRVDKLEDDMNTVSCDLKAIMTNHLPHIQQELASLKATMKSVGWVLGVLLTALIGIALASLGG